MMRAAFYERLGPATDVLQIGQVEIPIPAAGEVRVRIRASAVNPSDVKSRAGTMSATIPFKRVIPHNDGAGHIDAVGEGISPSMIGTRVWVWNAQFRRASGTAATHVTLPVGQVVSLPNIATYVEGACLGVPAMTAHRAVNCGTSVRGRVVLVAGGAGAVGRYALQMAKLLGARKVIATVGNAHGEALAKTAGADVVLNYRTPTLSEEILSAANGRVDRIVEVEWGANQMLDLQVIKPEGEIYVYGSAAEMNPSVNVQQLMMSGVTLHFRSVFLLPTEARQQAVNDLSGWIAAGALSHQVAAVLPLEEIARGHEIVERRTLAGRVVLDIQ